ncbi:tRNA lysidine(34) synthetase TilS [Nevskia ramosa]|uniref:tRNA lysidine(34) synthetase TilS n=1 Tax=Nevskia ramosa TaxID=64002 RepID=UPI0003B67D58|nr:tRNA lysidine(34) synthetase TilS [Nevskia ramosa]
MPSRPTSELIPPLPERAAGARVLVAYSGGLDSTVLLHALAQRGPQELVAVHVHHGLQEAADGWARDGAVFCKSLGVPMILRRAAIAGDDAAGPEGAAREARYALLRAQMQSGDLLVTAHHRDDQAETVLLRLLRGAGVHGLAAMRPLTVFAPGQLWRPLLDQPRTALRAYAEQHGLSWIDDPHNEDPRYARSWLRREVMPGLRTRFGQTDPSLARAARLAAEAADLLDERAAEDHLQAAQGAALSVSRLLMLSAARRHNLIRWWLHEQGFRAPFANHLDLVDEQLLKPGPDATPRHAWPGCELRRYRDQLHAMTPLPAAPAAGGWGLWSKETHFQLPGDGGMLVANRPPPIPLKLRSPQPGEAFRNDGAAHARTLRNRFQELGVAPWLRARIPVIEAADGALCMPGIGATREWRESLVAQGWQGFWRHDFAGLRSPLALDGTPSLRDCP